MKLRTKKRRMDAVVGYFMTSLFVVYLYLYESLNDNSHRLRRNN